jgi:hypothetical protein
MSLNSSISEKQIPRRTMIHDHILKRYQEEKEALTSASRPPLRVTTDNYRQLQAATGSSLDVHGSLWLSVAACSNPRGRMTS